MAGPSIMPVPQKQSPFKTYAIISNNNLVSKQYSSFEKSISFGWTIDTFIKKVFYAFLVIAGTWFDVFYMMTMHCKAIYTLRNKRAGNNSM